LEATRDLKDLKSTLSNFGGKKGEKRVGDEESSQNDQAELTAGLPDISWYNLPKRGKIYQMTTVLPNSQKYTKTAVKYSKWPKYTSIFHSKGLKNKHKLGFWQPWLTGQNPVEGLDT
jgi:hypothetical protein